MAAARTREISPVLISKGSPASEAQSGFCVEICLHCRDIGSKSRPAGLFIFSHTLHSFYILTTTLLTLQGYNES